MKNDNVPFYGFLSFFQKKKKRKPVGSIICTCLCASGPTREKEGNYDNGNWALKVERYISTWSAIKCYIARQKKKRESGGENFLQLVSNDL